MAECRKCGAENREGSRFCTRCGNTLEGPSQPTQTHPIVPGSQAPPVPPLGTPPAAPQQAPYYPPAQAPGYQPPAGAPQAAYPPPVLKGKARSKGPIFWVGAGLVLIAGVLVLIATWLSWTRAPGGLISVTGWDWYDLGKAGSSFAQRGEISNAFFIYQGSYPLFTGLCSLILGGAIAFFAALTLGLRMKGFAGITLTLSLLALGIAIVNLTSILRAGNAAPGLIGGLQAGVGIYIFLIFSALGLGGSLAALAG
ncbi:MAG: hypothetical protein A2Y75_06895 [Candidatus Solincola sediminis]|uniref:Zinc-ribbon domain-containing protein n=1 Tax=Candidatus Solincola sediminis TaxID=1797199 RepID=A0A1F2WJ47_9ACTN|nr:MAG: hypothetical protein A2Y75_06895 [Candidatus Solincola sediminis]